VLVVVLHANSQNKKVQALLERVVTVLRLEKVVELLSVLVAMRISKSA
jgi:hypothetical protein